MPSQLDVSPRSIHPLGASKMNIPDDVRQWVWSVFRACNVKTAELLATMPNTHETALDQAFITEAGRHSAPMRMPSEWIVRIDTHFLGGGRHWGEWEVADIGVLIQFRRGGKVVKTKVLLLQSKRLYPREHEFDEDDRADYAIGFGRLYLGDTSFSAVTKPRTFRFSDESRYTAFRTNDEQYEAIESYEKKYGLPVHYMLYHPPVVPHETVLPLVGGMPSVADVAVGARVVPAQDLRAIVASKPKGSSPSYGEVKTIQPSPKSATTTPPGWTVEDFIANLAIDCKVGHVAKSENDAGLNRIFNRRTGPISAAIAVTFDAPPGTNLGDEG